MEELSVLIESLINTLIGLTVLIMLFSIGLGMTFQQVTVLWRKPGKLAKGYNKVYREFFHTEPPAELPYRRELRRIWVRYGQSRFSTDQTLFDAPEHA